MTTRSTARTINSYRFTSNDKVAQNLTKRKSIIGAIQGFGGCPMATDTLTGNMPTEKLLSYFTTKKENTKTSPMSFESAYNEATKLFGEFH